MYSPWTFASLLTRTSSDLAHVLRMMNPNRVSHRCLPTMRLGEQVQCLAEGLSFCTVWRQNVQDKEQAACIYAAGRDFLARECGLLRFCPPVTTALAPALSPAQYSIVLLAAAPRPRPPPGATALLLPLCLDSKKNGERHSAAPAFCSLPSALPLPETHAQWRLCRLPCCMSTCWAMGLRRPTWLGQWVSRPQAPSRARSRAIPTCALRPPCNPVLSPACLHRCVPGATGAYH